MAQDRNTSVFSLQRQDLPVTQMKEPRKIIRKQDRRTMIAAEGPG
jgi:hypothetical protein